MILETSDQIKPGQVNHVAVLFRIEERFFFFLSMQFITVTRQGFLSQKLCMHWARI